VNAPIDHLDARRAIADAVGSARDVPARADDASRASPGWLWSPRRSLMARLLAVSAGFVLLAETVVFVPAMAEVRNQWLAERADTAEIAVLTARIGTNNGFRRDSADDLLRAASIRAIAVTENGVRKVVAGSLPPNAQTIRSVDIQSQTLGASLGQALGALFARDEGVLRIETRPRANAALEMAVYADEAPLRETLRAAAARVALTTLMLSGLIGMLIYASLVDGFVRPLRLLTRAIARFRDRPEDARSRLVPSGRADEIGMAEEAFADMQDALRSALLQRERLALLGTAVSKIAHDLRHSLGSAQLVTERLADVDDPVVRATAPRLERALSRAAGLAEASLRFGRADEPAPQPQLLGLAAEIQEAADEALVALPGVRFELAVPEGAQATADPDQLHRLLTNLIRNAGQAALRAGASDSARDACVRVRVLRRRTSWRIEIADTGPGLPDKVRANLFMPFSASGVSGGTGLGLAISRDLARMNGGDVELVSTGQDGTVFAVSLPDA
jgi:signal transduction histidine kinase